MASGYSGAFRKPDVRRTREEVRQSHVQQISRRLEAAATVERDWSRALTLLDRRYNADHVKPKHVAEFIDVFLRTTSDKASAAGLRAALDGCVTGNLPVTPELMVDFARAFRKRGDLDGAMEVAEQAHLLFEKGAAAAPAVPEQRRGASTLRRRRNEALADASKSDRDTAVLRKGERAKLYDKAATRRRPLVREELFKPRGGGGGTSAPAADHHRSSGRGDGRGEGVLQDKIATAMGGGGDAAGRRTNSNSGAEVAPTPSDAGLSATVKADLLRHVLAICADAAAFDRAAHAVDLLMPRTAASNPVLMPLLAKVRAESGSWLDALEIADRRRSAGAGVGAPTTPTTSMSADGIARAGRSAASAGQWEVALRFVERHAAAVAAADEAAAPGGLVPASAAESTLGHELLFSTLDATTRAGRWGEGLGLLETLVDRVGYVDGRAADLAFGRCRIEVPPVGAEAEEMEGLRNNAVGGAVDEAFPSTADAARGLAVRRCFEALSFRVDRFDLPPLATAAIAGHVTAAGDWTRGLQLLLRCGRSAAADLSRRSPPYVVAVAMATSAAAQMMPEAATTSTARVHPAREQLARAFAATPWLLRPELLHARGGPSLPAPGADEASPTGSLSEDLAPLPVGDAAADAVAGDEGGEAMVPGSSAVRPGRDAYARDARRAGGGGAVPMWQRYLHEARGRAAGRAKWAEGEGANAHADPDAEPVGAFDPDDAWHHANRTHNNLTENPKTLRVPLHGWKGPKPSQYKPSRSYRGGTV